MVGSYQADALQNITGHLKVLNAGTAFSSDSESGAFYKAGGNVQAHGSNGGGSYPGDLFFDAGRVARVSTETRSTSSAVAAVILV